MPKRYRTKISKEEFDNGIIPVNHILVKMDCASAEGLTTKAGITVGFLEDDTFKNPDGNVESHTADLAQVYGTVYKIPQKLYFNLDDEGGMPWDCDMELQEGDIVWFDIIEAKNAVEIECEGIIYRFIPYMSCFVAKRNRWLSKFGNEKIVDVILLNGFVLCSPVKLKSTSSLDITSQDKIDITKGIIAFCGHPVKRYFREQYCDIPDLRVGDLVQFEKRTPLIYLERKGYLAHFDGDNLYWVVQGRRIAMVLNR